MLWYKYLDHEKTKYFNLSRKYQCCVICGGNQWSKYQLLLVLQIFEAIRIRIMNLFRSYHIVIFKPLSHSFEETIGIDVKASFASRPVSRLIRWYNNPGDITKLFWEKAIQFHGTFHGLKITNCYISACRTLIV